MNIAKYIEVPSASKPGVNYIVILTPEGDLKCNCPSFTFRSKCHHIEEVGVADKIQEFGKVITEYDN